MHSRQSDNSLINTYPVVHSKLKHLTCTNCKHAFTFRGAPQFRGKIPLLLECGHVICETCAKTCPTKSCGHCGLVYSQNLDEQRTFSPNLYLLGLINASQSVLNSIEPNLEFQQPTAARFKKSITEVLEHCSECGLKADSRCHQCDVFFCNSCYAKIHGRALQNHHKISLVENASDICSFLSAKCELHPFETVQFYCSQCDVPACTHCLLLSHQGHPVISQSQKNDELKPQIEDMIDKLAETLQRVRLTEKKLAKPLTFADTSLDNETDREKIEARLTQHFTYLHGVLQNIENRITTQLQERQNLMRNNINLIKEQLEEQKDEIENAIMLATSALVSDLPLNVTAVIDKLEEALNLPCHLLQNSLCSDGKIELHIDESIVNSLKEHCSIHLPAISNCTLARTEELPDGYLIQPIIREEIARPLIPAIKQAQSSLSRSTLSMSTLSLRTSVTDQKQNGSLMEGTSDAVKITHIKDPSCFYAQSLCHSGALFQLHKSLAKQAATSSTPIELELNKMYLVQYGSDMKWYRGRVKTLYKDLENCQVCDIFYVDYGNTECSVPIRRMRNMSVQSSLVPIMARQCTLHDIVPKDGQWDVDTNKAMYEMLDGISHTIMHVFKVYNNVYHVDIMKNTMGDGDYTLSVRDALIFLEYGSFITNERLRKTNQQSLRKFFEEDIVIENMYSIRVTHIKSPDCIYVQKIGDGMTHLMKLTTDMMDEYGKRTTNKGIIYTPQIGMPCAALYNDGNWYRGRINNLLGNRKVEVFFVDYGDKRIYQYDEIRRLHYKFMSVTALAFKISLKDVVPLKNNEWGLETKKFMTQNLMSKFLKTFIFSRESDSYKVTLYIPMENKDINFNALLVEEKLALSTGSSSQFINIPTTVPKKRKKKDFKSNKLAKVAHTIKNKEDFENEVDDSDPFKMQVNILQVVSPDCLYVSDVESTKVMKKMTDEIQDFYNKYKSMENEDWEKDDICIAYSAKDKLYQRSKIVEIVSPEKVVVFFYDIGIEETVTIQDLQSLNPKFCILPARAFKIKLAGILPCGGSATWLSSSCEMLSDLMNEKQHSKFYISKTAGTGNDSISVELWVQEMRIEGPLAPMTIDINSINKKLVEKGVALPIRGYKDELNKVLTVELRQQLLQNQDKNISAPIEWVMKNTVSSISLNVRSSDPSAAGSSIEISEPDTANTNDNADTDTDADADADTDGESDKKISVPPRLSAWITAAPITDDRFCAVSTNVDQDCVIYLHSLKQNGDTLAFIDTTLQKHFSGSEPEACDMVWAPNDMCIAQYHADEKWYRAQVLEVLENDEIKVIFVDYGNIDECKLGTLRKRVITGHIPIQATKCLVQGLIPNTPDGKWSISNLDIIHALVVDRQSDVTTLERHPEHLVISMMLRLFNHMDLVTYLRYELNFEIREHVVETENQEKSNNADCEFDSLDNADVVIEEYIEDYVPDTIAEPMLFNPSLKFKSTSPGKQREAKNCDKSMTNLMDTYHNQTPVIDLCDSSENSLNLNSMMGSDDADHISLGGMTGSSYEKLMNVCSTPQNYEEDCIPHYTCIDVPDDVQIINLEPVHLETPTLFYARLDGTSKVLLLKEYESEYNLMMQRMESEAYNPPKLKDIKLASPCCARYRKDNRWYRAMITEILPDSDLVRVQYVDYGNSEYQPIDNIYALSEIHMDFPIMSLKCRIWGVRLNSDKPSWTLHKEKFEKIFYEGKITAKIKDRSSGVLDVELYSDKNCTNLLYDYLLDDGMLQLVEE